MPPLSEPRPSQQQFQSLDFGSLAAEREPALLPKVFLTTSRFRDLCAPTSKKVALLGNRGVGKSAALTMLGQHAEGQGSVVIRLSPEDYAYEYLGDSLAKEKAGAWAKQGAYTAAWKHLLYVSAMKAAIEASPGLKTGSAKRIYNFVRDNYAGAPTNPIGTLVSYLKRLESIKLGKLEAATKAGELQKLYSLEELNSLLQDLEAFCAEKPVLILIDELDRGWDASEDAIAFVAGLFQAAAAIPARTPSVRVVLTLRRELFESIPSLNDDAQKLRDAIEILDWSAGDLLSLISRRIMHSLALPITTKEEVAWGAVMPQTLNGRPSFEAILDFTSWRPREIIHICNQVLDIARHAERTLPFASSSIDAALSVYAKERCTDLVAEFRFQYPGLISIVESFRGCTVELSRSDLELHCLRLATGDIRVGDLAKWCLNKEPNELIDILWRIGFLRAKLISNRDENFVGVYQVRTANINIAHMFRVHEVFATFLDCRQVCGRVDR